MSASLAGAYPSLGSGRQHLRNRGSYRRGADQQALRDAMILDYVQGGMPATRVAAIFAVDVRVIVAVVERDL